MNPLHSKIILSRARFIYIYIIKTLKKSEKCFKNNNQMCDIKLIAV